MDEDNPYGITVLYQPNEGGKPQAVFDLVAIHGLNGHPLETWTHKQSKTMWLRDLLPSVLPDIRIMTYGYNAKFRNFTGHQDLRNISAKLLAELVDLRRTEQEKSRPIIFVCHSLGGIIAKKTKRITRVQALLLGCPEEQEKVQRLVYGLIFLGTPHHGSSVAKCAKMMANIVAACSPMNPARTILGVLQQDSKVLFEIMEDFVGKTTKLQLVSFFEMKMTTFGPFKRMIVEHHSAILNVPNEVTIGQHSDHREMARFISMRDRNFRPILARLEKFREDIVQGVESSDYTQPGTQVSRPKGEVDRIFDIPSLPSSIFRGREDILKKMEQYFHNAALTSPSQLTFAICGLGGSGKTQTALQFALHHRSKYKSGVFFLNASSRTTLIASFDRVFDLLGLENTINKVEATKRWLSRDGNSDWLLIFDNADDLDSVWIPDFSPAIPWGHIIITTRDQAAIGTMCQQGHVLEPLRLSEAILLFLEKSGLQNPSVTDYQEAQKIVELLGCLPLALDQGGAFVKTRQKTLTDYRRLYLNQQHELLKFKPRLGDYDKTVLTVWEVNFEQVERDSKHASDLLLLFCFLEPSHIPETMLWRGCSPQRRWDRHGEMVDVASEDVGVDESLISLITNEMDFDAAVDKLLSFSLIRRETDSNGFRSFSLHPLVQHCALQRVSGAVQHRWRVQALLLVCHAFPRNKYLDPEYGDLGRSQLAHVSRILQEYDKIAREGPPPPAISRELCSMLLAASRFSTTDWKREVVNRVKTLLRDNTDCYINAGAAHRESALLRMVGDLSGSNRTLERFIHSTVFSDHDSGLEASPQWSARRGDLVVSFAENLIQMGDLNTARLELCGWNPIDPACPSAMERIVLRSRNIALGRILRFEGKFESALGYLEGVLEESEQDEFFEGTGWRRVILSNVAEILCELDRPAEAEKLLMPELQKMTDRGCQNISSGRRLQLSLTESFIKRGMYGPAVECLLKLKAVYEAIGNPDAIAKRGMFRVLSSLARISHLRAFWSEALEGWQQSLKLLEFLGREEGLHSAIVWYSISHALFNLGRHRESSEGLIKARGLLENHERKFWIAGFNSYWFDFIMRELGYLNSICVDKSSAAT